MASNGENYLLLPFQNPSTYELVVLVDIVVELLPTFSYRCLEFYLSTKQISLGVDDHLAMALIHLSMHG